jgi:hypothetical protein
MSLIDIKISGCTIFSDYMILDKGYDHQKTKTYIRQHFLFNFCLAVQLLFHPKSGSAGMASNLYNRA